MQSNNIKEYILESDFQPKVYLKLCLLKYFQFRTSPNIKLLTLNDTMYVLNYLGCSFNEGDISTFVKLALRFKNLMKGMPQSIPINKDQTFDQWYAKFLKKLKSQIAESFIKIKAEHDENETFIKNYLSNQNIMRKCISLIERDIIEYSKGNKKSKESTTESCSVVNSSSDYIDNNDGGFSSEDEEPLTMLVHKKKTTDNTPETNNDKVKQNVNKLKSAVVSAIVSAIENSDSLESNNQQISKKTTFNDLISVSNSITDKLHALSSTAEQPFNTQSSIEDIPSNSQTLLNSLSSGSLMIDNTETVNIPTTPHVDNNPLITNVISLACDETNNLVINDDRFSGANQSNNSLITNVISLVCDETNNLVMDDDRPSRANQGGLIINSDVNPDNDIKKKLRSYDDLIKEVLNAEIINEVITLDDDDDNDGNNVQTDTSNLQANINNIQANKNNLLNAEEAIANNLQSNTSNLQLNEKNLETTANNVVYKGVSDKATINEKENETNEPEKTASVSSFQCVVNEQSTVPESKNAETAIIDNEINENSQNSNDITTNTSSTLVIDKQSINSVPFRTFIVKAKCAYRVIKSPYIDEYFQKHCLSLGNFLIVSQQQLLSVLCKNFLDINLYKRLEFYTDIVLSIFKFCVENSPELLEFTYETINNNKKFFNDILIQFKSMLKYMLYFCIEKLQIKLKTLQKYTSNILITPDDVQDLAISFNVPNEAQFKTLRLISQSNIIDIKHYPLPRHGLTIRQIYNFPGVSVKCQFTDIEFCRTNISSYKSSVTLSSRKTPVIVNKKIISDRKLKLLDENEKDVALSTKFLMNYFQSVFAAFQQGEITGIKHLRDVCTEFLKDIEYISPSRKAMVMNSEFHCSLSNYAYVVAPNINMNRVCLKHVINPEVKISLSEPDNSDQCYLKLICNLCKVIYDAFDSEQTIKNFSRHLTRVHGYFAESHTCVHCNKDFSFQELLNKRWMHECT